MTLVFYTILGLHAQLGMGMGMYVDLPERKELQIRGHCLEMLQVLGMNTKTLLLLHYPVIPPTTHPLQHCPVFELDLSHNCSL